MKAIRWLALTARLLLVCCLFGDASRTMAAADEPPIAASAAEAGERIDVLRAEIGHHDELYFKKAAPVISDYDYDQLKRELASLERSFPEFTRGGAATGDDRTGQFPALRHRQRMLSLAKSYTEAELRLFDARLQRQLGAKKLEYVVEPKFDGLAISVTYEKGRLVRAVTRGNGDEGDDVTANVRSIRTLPQALLPGAVAGAANPLPDLIELRGEIYIGFAEFARINREREAAGEASFANPRNLAAGTLKQLDVREVGQRRLEIVFYGYGACEPASTAPESQMALLRQLRDWGLPTIETPKLVQGADAMWQAVQVIGRERARYAFPTDGAVVKLNAGALQARMGVSEQAPLWAMAFKFAPDRVETQVKAISLQVGRTGVLTPVAELVPVQLGGSTVARATLHNRAEIARRDIRIGDFVYVEKAGEIVPAITGVDVGRRAEGTKPYIFPALCPECHSQLVQLNGEAAVRCPNPGCMAQVKRRIEHFASDAGVDISGLGPALIDRLVDQGWVKNVADLYRLRREDLLTLGSKVEKSTDRLLAGIEKSKQAEWWRFINGLGIPQVGARSARELAAHFGGLPELARAQPEDWIQNGQTTIPGVRDATAVALAAYLRHPENRETLTALISLGVQPRLSAQGQVASGPVAGKIFVLTGTLPHLTRAQASAKIVEAGGIMATSVSQNTNYVVAGTGSGAKLAAAHSAGVPVIDEVELLRLLTPP